ncbi:hypothetical protein RF11_02977 [Thelohanellus kitauei]|uniref:Uncharacterized protein n=1 Tax=Thelohanellus kitauei TaxID=669202 RepID=A0A0C2NC26_THEKT|nr:hypothetical protein RF11_02977 [Thelohanellus kitauei]
MFGRSPTNLIIDDNKYCGELEHFFGVRTNLAKIHEEAELNLSHKKQVQKLNFDHNNSHEVHFKPGDSVYLRIPSRSKISKVWESGWSVESTKGKIAQIANRGRKQNA